MRIVHVTEYFTPGLGYQENCLPAEQAKLGHDVHIVTSDRYLAHPNYEQLFAGRLGERLVGKREEYADGVHIHRLEAAFENERRNHLMIPGVTRYLRGLSPDVVQIHNLSRPLSLGLMLSDLSRHASIVCDQHLCGFNVYPLSTTNKAVYWSIRRLLGHRLRQSVSAWLPVNEDAREILAKEFGIAGANVHISRLGVDTNLFRPDPNLRAAARRRFGIPDGSFVIAHAGKLSPSKDVHLLLDAFRASGLTNATLIIAGSGSQDYMTHLKSAAGPNVQFLPFLPHEELPALFSAADLGVWPGDTSIVIQEALGCGLPSLVTRTCAAQHMGHCIGVIPFQRGDVEGLTAAMRNRSALPHRAAVASDARRLFDWSQIAADTIRVYESALNQTMMKQTA